MENECVRSYYALMLILVLVLYPVKTSLKSTAGLTGKSKFLQVCLVVKFVQNAPEKNT